MVKYTSVINFLILFSVGLGLWAVAGMGITTVRSGASNPSEAVKDIISGSSYRVGVSNPSDVFFGYATFSYVLSTFICLAVITSTEVTNPIGIAGVLLPQAVVVWNLSLWFPVEVSVVLAVLNLIVGVLVRERGFTI